MNAEIKPCKCDHKQQDEMYGKKMRAMNPFKGKDQAIHYRCTVCKAEV